MRLLPTWDTSITGTVVICEELSELAVIKRKDGTGLSEEAA